MLFIEGIFRGWDCLPIVNLRKTLPTNEECSLHTGKLSLIALTVVLFIWLLILSGDVELNPGL